MQTQNNKPPIYTKLGKQKLDAIADLEIIQEASLPSLDQRIRRALELDDVDEFNLMLESKEIIPNKIINEGEFSSTLLIEAAHHGSEKIVRSLVLHGADPKAVSALEDTPLTAVCVAGGPYLFLYRERLNIAQFLVEECKLDVNAMEGRNYTALHIAALYQFNDMIRYLIAKGAHPYALDGLERTPLELLTEQHTFFSVETFELLLAHEKNQLKQSLFFEPIFVKYALNLLKIKGLTELPIMNVMQEMMGSEFFLPDLTEHSPKTAWEDEIDESLTDGLSEREVISAQTDISAKELFSPLTTESDSVFHQSRWLRLFNSPPRSQSDDCLVRQGSVDMQKRSF